MSDEAAFLRAIYADPTDRTAKLVYADWLDDRGEAAKAEYVRAMVENRLAKFPVPQAWHELFHGSQPVWDEVTMLALGRLQGFFQALKLCSDNAADVGYDFFAQLKAKTGTLQELADGHYGPDCQPVRLEPLADWSADLRTILRTRLLAELGQVTSGSRLALQVDYGRDAIVDTAFDYVTSVITPTTGWHVRITEKRWYAIEWTDLMLEADDRVLFLHFSVDD